ncbi:MAG: GumC family protein [Gammaproteobacteria bacterium]
MLSAIWRRRSLILAVMVLITGITFAALQQITPLYTATAKVMLHGSDQNIVDIKQVVRSLHFDRYTQRGQIEVMKSRKMIQSLIDRMRLSENAYYNPQLRPESGFDPKRWVMDLIEPWLDRPSVGVEDPDEIAQREREALVDSVSSSLNVRAQTLSPVIEISFTTDHPRLSADLANNLADLYVYSQLETKFEATRKATVWLNERLSELRDQVRDSERAVEAYREKHGLVAGKELALTRENLSDLNSRYIVVQSERAEVQARYSQVRQVLKRGRGLDATADVLKSPVVQGLLEQESQLNRRIAELSSRYGERHPKMIDARSEREDLRRKLSSEVSKVASALGSELKVIQARERALRQALDDAKAQAATEGSAGVTLRELEREAEANRLIYENFLSRFKETREQESIQQADARVISNAAPPSARSSPRSRPILFAALFGSLLLGVVLVLLLESMDLGLKGADEIEELTGLPVLSMVPLAGRKARAKGLTRHVLDEPRSAIAESVRNLYTSLRLASPDAPLKCVAVTSALASEGKSTLTLWLAQTAVSQGRRVIIVDCDLRKPKVHEMFGFDGALGITDVIAGDLSLASAIKKDKDSGVDVLTGKPVHGSALELLASKAFSRILEVLAKNYDLVLLDAPPVLAVSDVRVLSPLVDTTLFVMQWNRVDPRTAQTALRQFTATGGKLMGVVVSQVNTRKHGGYGYGDYGQYYGKGNGYYHAG